MIIMHVQICSIMHPFQAFWEDNRKSLLRFLGEAHRGVKGFVKDENFRPIEGASMKVRGRDVGFQTTKVIDMVFIHLNYNSNNPKI